MQRGLGQRGAVLPLVAICLAVLLGFAGMAVDVGFLEYKYQAQQSATDAAALGGAEIAYETGCQSTGSTGPAALAAASDATLNGYTNGSNNMLVTPNNPPASGPYASNNCAVQVTIENQAAPTFFARVLGFSTMAESTTAVGLASQNNPGCIWLLSTSQQSNFSNSNINTPGCDIYINNSANFSNSTVNSNYIGYANGVNNISGANFTTATPQPMSQVSDPCPQMPGCAYLTNNTPDTNGCGAGNYTGNATIGTAGQITCFNSLTISGSNNTVCGIIAIQKTGGVAQLHMNGGGTSVSSCSSGVTFYLGANVSDINMSGGANLTLSAPSSGNTRGVLFWRDPSQGNSVNFSTCNCVFTGLMYFPTTYVNYSAATSAYTVMVFGQINISTTGLNLASPPPNGTVALKTVLAE